MKTKRLIAFLLTLIIVISQVPTSVFAKSDRLPEQEHEKFDFNSLEYVHLEAEEVEEIINRLNEISKFKIFDNLRRSHQIIIQIFKRFPEIGMI